MQHIHIAGCAILQSFVFLTSDILNKPCNSLPYLLILGVYSYGKDKAYSLNSRIFYLQYVIEQ